MENDKLILLIAIFCAIIIVLGGIARDAAEAHSQALNDTFQEGRVEGYNQGGNDAVVLIINQAEQAGIVQIPIDENTTYSLFSPDGCGLQVQAELQARGCRVVC